MWMTDNKMTRNGRKMCIFIATTRLGDSDFKVTKIPKPKVENMG